MKLRFSSRLLLDLRADSLLGGGLWGVKRSFEPQIGRSEPILLLETEKSRFRKYFVIKVEPITGGVVVESRIERKEKP